ncbi:hypothetical protein CI610_03523 [invertebrate metagenome]|uniref:Uncharacterized protein n=1 Tax=invertebrate metagenome TaxID=1711999 RepID=A0A2H9T2X6_9ZZZZ
MTLLHVICIGCQVTDICNSCFDIDVHLLKGDKFSQNCFKKNSHIMSVLD